MSQIIVTFRLVAATMLACCVGYTALVWVFANAVSPWTAQGSLIENSLGEVVGSAHLGQGFDEPQYFRPRLSAVDYNAAASGGSNLSPANPRLAERLKAVLAYYGVGHGRPLPADLATASGSGLDPDITLEAALHQAARVARARGLAEATLVAWLKFKAFRPGGLPGLGQLVRVLEVNRALDQGEVR